MATIQQKTIMPLLDLSTKMPVSANTSEKGNKSQSNMKHDKLKNAFDLSRFDFKKLQEFDDQIPLMKAKLAQD
jgi:hypothetical protein